MTPRYAVTPDELLAKAEEMADVLYGQQRALPAQYQERDVLLVSLKCAVCGRVATKSVRDGGISRALPLRMSAATARLWSATAGDRVSRFGCGAGPGTQLLELAPVPDGAA